jgi:predicted CXXCH cytochrome family protein
MSLGLPVKDFIGKIRKYLRITWIRNVSIVLLFVTCGTARVFSAKHPTSLDPNADTAKCLECHEGKFKAKSVHSAVAMGCLSCHEVRVANDVTRVKLTTTTVLSLCLKCHPDKKAVPGEKLLHPPAAQDCTKCHDPHVSSNKDHLLKALTGNRTENLCLKCHTIGLNVPANGSRHEPLDIGCDTCHVVHKSGAPGNVEFNLHLAAEPHVLCTRCHDIKDELLVKSHQGQPFGKADCLTCHATHQSDGPKLAQRFMHRPYAAKSCDVCHQAPKDGKVVLTKTDSKELCVSCHAETAKKIKTAAVQHLGAQGECIGCHDPHASRTPGYVRPDPVNACLRCHPDQAKEYKKKYLHQAAFGQGCSTCHDPHGGENSHLLRTKTINSLCLECHGTDSKPTPVKDAHIVTIFNGRVKLPEGYFGTVPRLPIKYGLGHPIQRHPVVDQMEPGDVNKVRVAINCISCHQPHASAERNLLVKDQANNIMFCAGCHKDMGK